MSARDEEIFPPVVVEVIESRSEAGHAHTERPHPAGRGGLSEVAFARVEVNRKRLALECDVDDVGIAIVIDVAKICSHARDEGGIFSESDVSLECHFFEFVAEVVEQKSVLRVIGHEEIRLAIEIVVGHSDAHAFADMIANAPFTGNIFESAVALVEKKLIGKTLVVARMAVFGHTLDHALGNIRVSPLQIVDDEQIEQAIVVDVDPHGGNRPQWSVLRIGALVEACLYGDIGKSAVAVVVVQGVAMDSGDEDVRMAIVVVVANGYTDVKSRSLESCLFGDVGESAITVIAKETVVILRRSFLQGGNVGAIGEEDVGAAVTVVVEDCDTSGHGFRHVLRRAEAAVEMKGELL